MKLTVGFITYNNSTFKYLPYFIPSLKQALSFLKPEDYKVLVVDNSDKHETDNQDFLKTSEFKENLEVFSFHKNIGFANGYNFLLRLAEKNNSDYFLVVNPDIILEKNSLKLMLEFLKENNWTTAVSPKILKWDFENKSKSEIIDTTGLYLKTGLRFSDYLQNENKEKCPLNSFPILGPSGAGGMYNLTKLKSVKQSGDEYFDKRMFMYKEDCDLAYRMNLKNLKSVCLPEAVFYHDRSVRKTGKTLSLFKSRRNKTKQEKSWSFLNQHIIFLKHFKHEKFISKFFIVLYIILMFFFVLIFEPYLLKQYKKLFSLRKK